MYHLKGKAGNPHPPNIIKYVKTATNIQWEL